MANNQKQGQAPDKGRAKRIAATSKVFDKAYGIRGLKRPGRKAKAAKPKQ